MGRINSSTSMNRATAPRWHVAGWSRCVPATTTATTGPRPLRLGFIPLTDAAPLIVAHERGFFARHGLRVALFRQLGWATVRDKILYGELDAAHALAGMLLTTALGVEGPRGDVLTGCVLSLNGNTITLGRALCDAGVRDAATLRAEIRRLRGERRVTFGVVHPGSFHHVQLHAWLRSGGISPADDVRTVVVPPAQMHRNLAAGTIDGCCVGEPWGSLAVRKGTGRIVEWSARQFPDHVEKVLLVHRSFAEREPRAHAALIAALVEAAAWCDEPANRPELVDLLARPAHLDLEPAAIAPALVGPFACGDGETIGADGLLRFHRGDANRPDLDRAGALIRRTADAGLIPADAADDPLLPARLFREDLFDSATNHDNRHETTSV